MNMERRLKKLNGLQPVYINVNNDPMSELEPFQDMIEDLDNDIEQIEVFTMEDTPVKSAHRAVGIDIGTGFISCAEMEGDKVQFRKVRDAFFKLNPSQFLEGSATQFGENMLKTSGAHYVKVDDILYVLGDSAFQFASLFHQECLRPMSKGVLNPKEPVSNLMVEN